MNFFKSFLAAILALFVFSILTILFFVALVGSLTAEKPVEVKANSVLHLMLDAQITEMQVDNPLEGLPLPGADVNNVGLLQLKQVIAHAKTDDDIKGIYLDCSYPEAGFATIEEIRQSLLDFRKSGKWVLAYNQVYSEKAYYLASAADKIYLNPHGDMEFNGLTIEMAFYKKLFEKLEIKPQIFRVGEFKSAVEPFMLEKMSAENELQITELANSMYNHVVERISESRNIPAEKLHQIADNMEIRDAKMAKDAGLVDELYYDDEFHANIRERLGVKEKDDITFIKYGKYRKSFSTYSKSKNEIAVIVADGTIMPGENEGQDNIVAGETFVKEIRKARNNEKVKAIVIRINSPGGEFRASDMMWREIELAKKQKPVIASMSDYAASGGYYMAMGCDTIVAQPHTITGSIGIFGMMFDMSGFLGNKLGITFDEVRTGNFGEMYTVSRPLTEAERNFWQKSLDEHYNTFTSKAAQGRGVSQEEILKVASGRVWTGTQARERNLVDVEGGFDDAVKLAAAKVGVADDYKTRFYPKQKNFIEEFFSEMEEDETRNAVKEELGEMYIFYQQLKKIKTYQGAQARMPFELDLQ